MFASAFVCLLPGLRKNYTLPIFRKFGGTATVSEETVRFR